MSEPKERENVHFPHIISDETRAHFRNAHEEMHKGFESLFPKEFIERRKAARREMLMGIRSMIDDALKETDRKQTA